ncbi:hypothetical protein A0H81_12785 [Grifola frondosa]|uniref:Uncharacterized protein n=1 Tax=Grifola frondosa TaxID=5627 RepID=A0A1C7LRJ7_GRIFR|nr:hypothetical protein A0H81_12785 [Grifola frondosa]
MGQRTCGTRKRIEQLSFECAHSVQFCPLCTKYGRCISCKIHSQNILAHYRRRSPHLCSLSDFVSITFPSSLVLPSDFSSLPSPRVRFPEPSFLDLVGPLSASPTSFPDTAPPMSG